MKLIRTNAIISEIAMKALSRFPICRLGVFNSWKTSKPRMDAIRNNPGSDITGLCYTHPLWTNLASSQFGVRRVLPRGRGSEVVKSVIQAVSVSVVNVNSIFSSHPLPDDAVDKIRTTIKSGSFIEDAAIFSCRPRFFAVEFGIYHSAYPLRRSFVRAVKKVIDRSLAPRQRASFWVVIKALAQICLIRQNTGSHRISPRQSSRSEVSLCYSRRHLANYLCNCAA
jgi:hypothetical protein